ncbi:MAG: acetyl-CoA carboxylase biotin carboxylase subunit [Pelagibacteraceae bacterium]|nr:acetyl-CoA carboxylase biotin carboxylase subunit [Pelagibacteraceae bacterium]PHX88852.1 MAG: acetyl-CoA carboxylase biotin carboxylase subunit [Pelagibacteraceae bacterium]
MFKKILIANRGEIAVRIIRACKEWGISTVAVHSDVDRDSMHVRLADESVCIGSHQPANSYLNIPALMSAIELTKAEAVHPGYGFLSENHNFARILEKNKIKFIGPSSNLIQMMGDKINAKKIAKENGLTVIEGSEGGIKNIIEAKELSKRIGFPVLIKASGGGGGKGMKIVHKEEQFETLFYAAKSEALKYFGNDEIYIEKFFQNPRHIEVQILAGKNRVVHLHERDCTVQRRHQKLIEETPSPVLNDVIRKDLFEKTVTMVTKIAYMGAGTVEFIYEDGKFYFLEMNTRIQVEHPVTEMVTGIDIIKEQISIAFTGETALKQSDINPRGHAIECRINAEDPSKNFQPSPGTIGMCHQPSGFRTRVDGAIFQGYKVTPYYDSLICKLICQGRNRTEAIQRMNRSLDEFVIEGITTTIPLHKKLLNHKKFINSDFNVSWLDNENIFNNN